MRVKSTSGRLAVLGVAAMTGVVIFTGCGSAGDSN